MQKSNVFFPSFLQAKEEHVKDTVHAKRLTGAKRAVFEWATFEQFEKVLDLSTDDGSLLYHLSDKYRLHLCGMVDDMEKAKEIREIVPHADIVPGRALDIPWHDSAFKSVLCTRAPKEFDDFGSVLKEMYRVLKEGGQLVLSAPYTLEEGYTPHKLMRMLQERGFKNVSYRMSRLSGVLVAWKKKASM